VPARYDFRLEDLRVFHVGARELPVDWQSLPTQLPRFAPALAGGLIVLCPMISAT
jgi:hypothetical protein